MRLLFLLFIVVPIMEMWVLIEVGRVIGAPLTILAVAATAFIGVWLLRQQGLSTLLRANQRLESGEIPATELVEGIMLAVGGALLLTPGFVTDCIGFSCLLPYSRRAWAGWLMRNIRLKGDVGAGFTGFHYHSAQGENAHATAQDADDALNGEFFREKQQNQEQRVLTGQNKGADENPG